MVFRVALEATKYMRSSLITSSRRVYATRKFQNRVDGKSEWKTVAKKTTLKDDAALGKETANIKQAWRDDKTFRINIRLTSK